MKNLEKDGTMEELKAAEKPLVNYIGTLLKEIAARQKAETELKTWLDHHVRLPCLALFHFHVSSDCLLASWQVPVFEAKHHHPFTTVGKRLLVIPSDQLPCLPTGEEQGQLRTEAAAVQVCLPGQPRLWSPACISSLTKSASLNRGSHPGAGSTCRR